MERVVCLNVDDSGDDMEVSDEEKDEEDEEDEEDEDESEEEKEEKEAADDAMDTGEGEAPDAGTIHWMCDCRPWYAMNLLFRCPDADVDFSLLEHNREIRSKPDVSGTVYCFLQHIRRNACCGDWFSDFLILKWSCPLFFSSLCIEHF